MNPENPGVIIAAVVITLSYLAWATYVVHRAPPDRLPRVIAALASFVLVLPVILYGPRWAEVLLNL
ncbi:hypothetical protein ACIBF1_10955 [Spirillospora sp. NPDC050679]